MNQIRSIAAGGETANSDEKEREYSGASKIVEETTTTQLVHDQLATGSNTGKENHNDQTDQPPSFVTNVEQQQQQQQECHACNRPLARSKHLVRISGQSNQWHSECFRCNICQISMDKEISCHIYRDKILCRDDYLKLQRDLTTKCSRCHWPIGASDWVRRASHHVYHLACFSCDICQRQLSTGEQFTMRIQKKNAVRFLCGLHFAVKQVSKCQQLKEMATAQDNDGQLRERIPEADPSICAVNMTSQSFSEQAATDEERYLNLLASTSGQQQADLERASFLLKQQHGERGVDSDRLLGESYTRSSESTDQFQSSIQESLSLDHHHHHHLQLQQIQQQQQQQQQQQHHQHDRTHTNNTASSITSSESSSTNGGNSSSCHNLASLASKSKRVRTTFTEDQLSILQNHFQIDSNPDGQDLERIAVITGLTKRVTQVWFQNSRARQKKCMTKRKPNQLAQATPVASNNSTPCSDILQVSQHHYDQSQQQHQQRLNQSIGGECFTLKVSNPALATVSAHKWLHTTTGDNTMSASMSSQDETSRMDDLEETQSSMMDDEDVSGIRKNEDRSTDDSAEEQLRSTSAAAAAAVNDRTHR